MKNAECIDPKCTGVPIKRPQLSTWAAEVYFCPKCDRSFSIPTRLGQLRDFAPAVIAGCAVIGVEMKLGHLDEVTALTGVDDTFGNLS